MHEALSDAAVPQIVERVYAAGCDLGEWQRVVEYVHSRLPGIAFSTG